MNPLSSLNIQLPTLPTGTYADVRCEVVHTTQLRMRQGEPQSAVQNSTKGAYVRVCVDGRWQGAATTDFDQIVPLITKLAASDMGGEAGPDAPSRLQAHQDIIALEHPPLSQAEMAKKIALVKELADMAQHPLLVDATAIYMDEEVAKRFISTKGADIQTHNQRAGVALKMVFDADGELTKDAWQNYAPSLDGISLDGLQQAIDRTADYAKNATPLPPGEYPVVLSPVTAGVFAHESFGHFSEADFMMGDPDMLKSWELGKKVGAPCLSLADDGHYPGTGNIPYDDEGQKGETTWLIKEGMLQGRLHSAATAASLDDPLTGNARAMDFRFAPIVRMTSTYIAPGKHTKEQVFDVKDGLFVETFSHGSGMSTFTIAPTLAWRIRDGKIAEPVRVAVITGTIFETLGLIDAVSDGLHIHNTVTGGCGKGEQSPLPVSFGGPYVRVSNMKVA